MFHYIVIVNMLLRFKGIFCTQMEGPLQTQLKGCPA